MGTCPTVQIQAVTYHNEVEPLMKAIRSAANAVRVAGEVGRNLGKVTFTYGDASEERIFSDEQVRQIREEFGAYLDFRYEVFGFNSGFGKGHNLMGLHADADYLLIMNPDVVLCPRFFLETLYPFDDPEVGLVEARQTPIEHHKEYDPETFETDWASGACIMIPSRIYRELNGYDSDTFFMYCEDVDLSWRLRLMGYKIFYQPLAPVFHAKYLSVKANWQPSRTEEYYSAVSSLLMAHKWSNSRRVNEILRYYQNCPNKNWREAAAHFLELQEENKLPLPIDPEHKVAQFVGNYYSENRFIV